jgi:hypothetical protein
MVKGKDEDVLSATWACFYVGDNPHSNPNETFKTEYSGPDEFFLAMDGKAVLTKGGVHPGIFVSYVLSGMPEDYGGYGPKHGGLVEETNDPHFNSENNVSVRTFDDLGSEIRFASFWYTPDKEGKYTTLVSYEEVRIRKSSGRFEEKKMSLRVDGNSTHFTGQCLRLK